MSRISKKFILILSTIIISINVLCILVNNTFVERYYLRSKKIELAQAYEKIINTWPSDLYEMSKAVEKEEGVVIVYVKKTDDLAVLNDKLAKELQDRGMKLSKFWLWDADYQKLIETGEVNQIYNQVNLEYSVLIKFIDKEGMIIAIAKIIPHIAEAIGIINQFTTLIFFSSIIIMILCIAALVRRMTKPLTELSKLSGEIANLNFQKINITTHDEIEDLAHSINDMSEKLEKTHGQLQQKNKQMKELLSNVSHELKTPISLVKAYASGIKDGMDDGTFLEVIIQQNEQMQRMVEELLHLARVDQEEVQRGTINLRSLIDQVIQEHQINRAYGELELEMNCIKEAYVKVDPKGMYSVFTNLLTNAMKYTYDGKVTIDLKEQNNIFHFSIANKINPKVTLTTEQIWEPFYVGEKSRNKELSGTGLGLAIVKSILDKHELHYGCLIENGQIIFYIAFEK